MRMSWSGEIVDENGEEVDLAGEEAAAWRGVTAEFFAKHGQAPWGLERGYIHLSSTQAAAREMGYSLAHMHFDAADTEFYARVFEDERPKFIERHPDDAYWADYLVAFFKTAAQFKRGVIGGV